MFTSESPKVLLNEVKHCCKDSLILLINDESKLKSIVGKAVKFIDLLMELSPPLVNCLHTSVAPFQFVAPLKYKCGYVISA